MTTEIYTKIKSMTRTAMAMETSTKIECMEVMPLFLSIPLSTTINAFSVNLSTATYVSGDGDSGEDGDGDGGKSRDVRRRRR
jgi:hypothetical protein